MFDCSLVTEPSELSLYRPTVDAPPSFTTVGSAAIKNPRSDLLVETSPENDATGDKSKVEVNRELKSFFANFFITLELLKIYNII